MPLVGPTLAPPPSGWGFLLRPTGSRTFRGTEAATHLCKAFKTGASLSGSHLMRMRPKTESKRSTRGARPGPSRQDSDRRATAPPKGADQLADVIDAASSLNRPLGFE